MAGQNMFRKPVLKFSVSLGLPCVHPKKSLGNSKLVAPTGSRFLGKMDIPNALPFRT